MGVRHSDIPSFYERGRLEVPVRVLSPEVEAVAIKMQQLTLVSRETKYVLQELSTVFGNGSLEQGSALHIALNRLTDRGYDEHRYNYKYDQEFHCLEAVNIRDPDRCS